MHYPFGYIFGQTHYVRIQDHKFDGDEQSVIAIQLRCGVVEPHTIHDCEIFRICYFVSSCDALSSLINYV